MTPVGSALSGLIAYACGANLEDDLGIPSWKWLFVSVTLRSYVF
jgi:hypothetical protein